MDNLNGILCDVEEPFAWSRSEFLIRGTLCFPASWRTPVGCVTSKVGLDGAPTFVFSFVEQR